MIILFAKYDKIIGLVEPPAPHQTKPIYSKKPAKIAGSNSFRIYLVEASRDLANPPIYKS